MSRVTHSGATSAAKLTDALVLESMALHQKAANGAATSAEHRVMSDRLGAAMAVKKASQAANGGARAGSGRPKNWYAVMDHVAEAAQPTQDLGAVAEYLGLTEATLRVYLAQSARGGRYAKMLPTANGDVEVWVAKAEPAQAEYMAANPATPLWTAPVAPRRAGQLVGTKTATRKSRAK